MRGSSSSEDALRSRVEQYYSALQQGDWAKAEKCLTKESRTTFRGQLKKPVMAYKLRSIKLEPDGKTATVVVEVPVVAAAMPRPIPVPSTTLWRLVSRTWCMELSKPDPNANQALFGMSSNATRPPSPVVTSQDLKFDSIWCGLGNVQIGETPVAKFPFKNISSHPVTLGDIQLGCDCLRLKTQQMEYKPGEAGTLEIEFNSARLGITMDESFSQVVVLKTQPGDGYVLLTIAARVAPAPKPAVKP
jgi:hypothetical protein